MGPVLDLAVGTRASVRVPATSANLGPGYDALGLALAWYDDVTVEVTPDGLSFDIHGESADTAPRDESHLIVASVRTALAELGVRAPGLHLSSTNRIPHGRGLGSSAAAICAGVLAAQGLAAQGLAAQGLAAQGSAAQGSAAPVSAAQAGTGAPADPPDGWALACAARIEGHPDNVAPCLAGGLTVAWVTPGPDAGARSVALGTVAQLRPVAFVPPFESSTVQARRLLPAQVPHVDAAFNAARAALLVAALTTRPDVLFDATEDRLHQRYRAPAMPESAALVDRLRAEGLAAVISGAGPTVLALAISGDGVATALNLAPPGWRVVEVDVDRTGARLTGAPRS